MPFILYLLNFLKRLLTLFKITSCSSCQTFTVVDMMEHKNDRWVIIDDDVYCLASMRAHSGGLDIIGELSGRDVTRIFHEVHLTSSENKQLLNRKYRIGKVDRSIAKEGSAYFLKEKLIFRTVPECHLLRTVSFDEECLIKEQFKRHIAGVNFPCMNGKLAVRRNAFGFGLYDILATKHSTTLLWHDLVKFVNRQSDLWNHNHMLTTYVACFRTPKDVSEDYFEKLLWKQLRLLHAEDFGKNIPWAEDYSDNPIDPNFGFSVGGRAFFIVGLHPNSSRQGRRFIMPAIAFNSHDQFKNLRRLNMITEIRQVIRRADLRENGSVNPNLIPNDDKSVAFEYSGKLIQPGWTPDFESRHQTSN